MLNPLPNSRHYRFARRELLPLGAQGLWRIETGYARTITWDEEGLLVTLGFWRAGDVVGQALSGVNPYQIECLTPVEASLLSCKPLNPPELLALDVHNSHIQQAQELLRIVHARRIDTRLLNLLQWLALRFGHRITQGWLIDLRLTHQDLADVIGATRVTVTRLLNQLEQQGRIGWSSQRQIWVNGVEHLAILKGVEVASPHVLPHNQGTD